MSEQPSRVPEIPLELPPPLKESQVAPQERHVSLLERSAFIVGFIMVIAVMMTFVPRMAKHVAYSWNIGVERAKAEVARKFLNENPGSDQRIAMVVKAVAPSVVGIRVITTRSMEDYGFRRGRSDELDTDIGSGIIIDAQEGYILTNYHVIANALSILVYLSDGREIEAEVIGQDRLIDFAVLRIDADDLESILWGDSRQVTVGEQVVAIGSPYGLQQTVTSGIVSATERFPLMQTVQGARRSTRLFPHEFLQTDAAINPGNSGGALVNMNGKLIGICTAILSAETGGNSGIGFAIPSFTAKRIYDEIVLHGEIKHGWIGVDLEPVTAFDARQMNQKKPMGALVRGLGRERSPARDAGIQRRDIILRWGETEIKDPLHLTHVITLTKPGTKETVEVFRGGELLTIEITVGERPTDL
jgi:S1-C subfamily serine protease